MSDRKTAPQDNPLFVSSLAKAMRVLEAFGPEKSDWGISEIAKSAGVPVSAAQRFIFSFCELGYLRRDERSRRYRLSEKALGISYSYLKTNPLVRMVSPVLLRLQDRCPQRVDLSIRSDLDVVVLSRAINPAMRAAPNPIGRRVRLAYSSGGRAIMAHLPDEEIASILSRTERKAVTPYTLLDDGSILNKVSEAKLKGYSIAEQEVLLGENVISAALLNGQGFPVAAIHVSAPSAKWTAEKMEEELSPMLLEAVASIESVP